MYQAVECDNAKIGPAFNRKKKKKKGQEQNL